MRVTGDGLSIPELLDRFEEMNSDTEDEDNTNNGRENNSESPTHQTKVTTQLADRRARESFDKQSEQYDTGSKKDRGLAFPSKSKVNINSDENIPEVVERYGKGNSERESGGGRRSSVINPSEVRRRKQQARATRHTNRQREYHQAVQSFRQQSKQFDTGSKKFKASLKPSTQEVIKYVQDEWKNHSKRYSSKKVRAQAREIARIEREANAAVRANCDKVRDGQHGQVPLQKPDDVIRFMFENWNSLCLGKGLKRVRDINALVKRWDADVLLGCETQYDWRALDDELQFKNLFGVGEEARYVASNNITRKPGVREQHGGTAGMVRGRLSSYVIDTGSDTTKLGRWSWILFGIGEVRTRVIVAYQPSKPPRTSKGGTVWDQHMNYFTPRGQIGISPRTLFYEHLTAQLKAWKAAGEELLLFGDFNENVYTGRLSRRLAEEDINMHEQFRAVNKKELPPTHVRSKKRAVCAVFATAGAECLSACVLPKYAGVGDHRLFILDFSSASLIGTVFPKIVRAPARKLHCHSDRIRTNYVNLLNQLTDRHRMFHKLNKLALAQDELSPSTFQLLFNKWDEELTQLMLAAENKCNTYKSNHIPYSPEVGEWITRRWLLGRIRRYLQGKVPDPRNLYRQCRRHRLPDPREITEEDLNIEIFLCYRKIEELKPKAPKLRRDHLNARLKEAKEENDLERVLAIQAILRRESDKKRWKRINRTQGKSQGRSVVSVKVPAPTEEDPDAYTEYNTAEGIFSATSDNLADRFRLAFTAPCYSGKLFDDIGYLGDTEASRQILEGTYEFDPDEDPGTRLLLEEAAITFSQMSGEEIATYVTVDDFQHYWQRVNERTSSSYSGLHFSHYKAASFDIHLSALHAKKLSMAAKAGVPLKRWGFGVTVLLEKICGNNYVHKLRAICLLEADFNWWNKLVFARRMMAGAKKKGVIPIENCAKKGSHVDHALMMKRWFSDISKVLHWPASMGSCDFSDCYDRAAHGVSSIGLQAWGIPPAAVSVLLKAMQIMQFCVRTGFGESDEFFGGTEDKPFGGFGQGNGAAPPGFAALSALVVNAYKRMGENGAKLTSCYTSRMFLLAAVMYVDDTDLCHMAATPTTSDAAFITTIQNSTDDWGQLSQATGGALKPSKCLVYIQSYKFVKGVPRMKRVNELPEPSHHVTVDGKVHPSHITIPQPDGSSVPIPTFEVDAPSKMLGYWFSPAGDGKKHVGSLRKKGLDWVDNQATKPLPPCDAWLSFHMQLIPGMSWGLLAVTMSPQKLEDAIMSVYFKILPSLRVNRHITKGWRMTPARFQGLGMPNFVVWSFASKVYFLQCFWGFRDHAVGEMLHHAYEAFLMEVGLGGNIFVRDFDQLGCLASDGTWFKCFWQYAHHLGISFVVHEDYHLQPLRVNDTPIMELFLQAGWKDEIVGLNRVRKYNKLTHISEAVMCDGRAIDQTYLNRDKRPSGQVVYSLEMPTPRDFNVWNQAIKSLTRSNLNLYVPLGAYLKLVDQNWFVADDSSTLYRTHLKNNIRMMDVFVREERRHNTRRGAVYNWMWSEKGTPSSSRLASVLTIDTTRVHLHSSAPLPLPISVPTDFWTVLQSFENRSLWKYFKCDGDGSWITDGLRSGTLVCVHDGSYMVHLSRDVCSAAFVIHCTATGKRAVGSVVEQSDDASNYRGEILGGMMIQLVLRAASRKDSKDYCQVEVCCDNIGVVQHGNDPTSPLSEKQSQADTLRCLKQYINENPFEVVYKWVKGHQDDLLSWDELNLTERLNCLVDNIAKKSLISAVLNNEFIHNFFPFEQVRVVLGSKKLTSSPKRAFDKFWGYRTAKTLYAQRKIISRQDFHLVWWDGVERFNYKVPKMFSVWLTKQTSHFAGTNLQLHRINNDECSSCPSCGFKNESVQHLTRCKDAGRYEMLKVSVADLRMWLERRNTDAALIDMIEEYLLAQGEKLMVECSPPPRYLLLAKTHDRLGWDNFLEGRFSVLYLEEYRKELPPGKSPYSVESWGIGFMERLVRITHSQWIFRNSHIHYKKKEGLTERQHLEIFRRVEEMMWKDPMDILPMHRHLLEDNIERLGECSTAQRLNWLESMEAAVETASYVLAGRECRDRWRAFVPCPKARTRRLQRRLSVRKDGSKVYRHSSRGG